MGEWLAVTVTSAIAGMGGAMAWLNKNKTELHTRMDDVEKEMKGFTDMHAEHNTQLAVIENCQMNTASTLVELKGLHAEMNKKMDDVLKEIRRS